MTPSEICAQFFFSHEDHFSCSEFYCLLGAKLMVVGSAKTINETNNHLCRKIINDECKSQVLRTLQIKTLILSFERRGFMFCGIAVCLFFLVIKVN